MKARRLATLFAINFVSVRPGLSLAMAALWLVLLMFQPRSVK